MRMDSHDLIDELFAELAIEEQNLVDKEEAAFKANINQEVAAKKYAAVRDMVEEQLGYSPYTKPLDEMPPYIQKDFTDRGLKDFWGRHRFITMNTGDAIVMALSEVDVPVDLGTLAMRLQRGGLEFADIRSINAALIRTKGVKKTDDGKYYIGKD